MAPTIPASANAAMIMAAKRTLSEAGPRTLRHAGYAIVVRRGVTFLQSDAQKITFGVFFGYLVAIAIISYIPVVNKILWPFKMLTVSFHEFGHALACVLTCGKVDGLELDPREGGCTHMHGGLPWVTLPAGYLGSAFMGALLIFCGYNIVASKIASFVIGVVSILSLYWGMKTWFKKKYNNPWVVPLIIAINDGLMVACWFIADSEALRFYVVSGSLHVICTSLMLTTFRSCSSEPWPLLTVFGTSTTTASGARSANRTHRNSQRCLAAVFAVVCTAPAALAFCGTLSPLC